MTRHTAFFVGCAPRPFHPEDVLERRCYDTPEVATKIRRAPAADPIKAVDAPLHRINGTMRSQLLHPDLSESMFLRCPDEPHSEFDSYTDEAPHPYAHPRHADYGEHNRKIGRRKAENRSIRRDSSRTDRIFHRWLRPERRDIGMWKSDSSASYVDRFGNVNFANQAKKSVPPDDRAPWLLDEPDEDFLADIDRDYAYSLFGSIFPDFEDEDGEDPDDCSFGWNCLHEYYVWEDRLRALFGWRIALQGTPDDPRRLDAHDDFPPDPADYHERYPDIEHEQCDTCGQYVCGYGCAVDDDEEPSLVDILGFNDKSDVPFSEYDVLTPHPLDASIHGKPRSHTARKHRRRMRTKRRNNPELYSAERQRAIKLVSRKRRQRRQHKQELLQLTTQFDHELAA